MEDDVREYLVRIANTIAKALIWMLLVTFIGLKFKWAFINNKNIDTWKNVVFYIGFFTSFILLSKHIYKAWFPKTKI